MVTNGDLAEKRWMVLSKHCGDLSVQLMPLLAERLDTIHASPGMLLLVGSPASTELAGHLGASSAAGEILLDVDPTTKIIRVNCPTALRHVEKEDHCPGDSITWATRNESKDCLALANIYARLLGPFTHVVCIFVSSFTSTVEIGNFLSSWLRSAIPTTKTLMPPYSAVALPRLVVVTDEKSVPNSMTLGELKVSLQGMVLQQTGFPLTKAFSDISVKESLTEAGLLRQRRYTKMTAVLATECEAARKGFEQSNMLYDTNNLVDLFSRAYRCLLTNSTFNPVSASRAWNSMPPNAAQQTARFLSDFKEKDDSSLQEFALPYLVSAIRSNAYPEASHYFGFALIFNTIYKSMWLQAAQEANLESNMCFLFERIVKDYKDIAPAADTDGSMEGVRRRNRMGRSKAINLLHSVTASCIKSMCDERPRVPESARSSGSFRERGAALSAVRMSSHQRRHFSYLSMFRDRLRSHKVHHYCPVCILRRPEYGLPCGHMYCEYDIKLIGRKIGRGSYAVDNCICCEARFVGVVFSFRPKTRGITVLALDGGGVRGIMILQCLQMLQKRLWNFLPATSIIDLFDVCTGTSTGGICALTLAHKGIPVEQAIKDFISLSQQVFVAQPLWSRIVKLLTRGSVYASRAIDEPLRIHYGESTLSDYTPATARAAKVLVTVTGTPDGDHVLTNFNGVGLETSRYGFGDDFYHRGVQGSQKILAREAARCTSAAPGIFPAFTISGVGTFQDGGLWRNMPLGIAFLLLPALCPGQPLPDFALSIGTGCERKRLTRPSASSIREQARSYVSTSHSSAGWHIRFLCSVFIVASVAQNIYRSQSNNLVMDCEKHYSHLVEEVYGSQLPSRCRRLNVEFPAGCPSLDDVESLPTLIRTAVEQYQSDPVMQESLEFLISSRFYFELSNRPTRHDAYVSFCGRILCTIRQADCLDHFIHRLKIQNASFSINGKHIALEDVRGGNGGESWFELSVRGTTDSLHTPLEVFLYWDMEGEQSKSRISLSPFTLAQIMDAQGWDLPHCRARRAQIDLRRKRGADCEAASRVIKKARRHG